MATITEDDVWRAADELLEAEENPTIERVRARLGGGSQTTIVKYLKTWRVERDGPARLDLPDVPDNVAEAFRACWAQAAREARTWAEGQYQQARDAMAHERAEGHRAISAAREAERKALHNLDVLQERLTHTDKARVNAERHASETEEALAAVNNDRERERNEAAARERVVSDERNNLVESLAATRKALAEALRRNRANERDHLRVLAAEKTRYEADTARWMQELDNERQQKRRAERDGESALAGKRQAEGAVAQQKEAYERLERDYAWLREQLGQAEETARELARQVNADRRRDQAALAESMGAFAETQHAIKEMIEVLRHEQNAQADHEAGDNAQGNESPAEP